MGCEMSHTKVVMKKPVYLGQTILDLSKIVMYEFHYDYMKPKSEGLQLCYMDTDPLVYHIKTEDFYADIANDVKKDLIPLVTFQLLHGPIDLYPLERTRK